MVKENEESVDKLEELLPCPHCGHTPILDDRKQNWFYIWCNCGANVGYRGSKKVLIKAWNTRALPSEKEIKIKAVRAFWEKLHKDIVEAYQEFGTSSCEDTRIFAEQRIKEIEVNKVNVESEVVMNKIEIIRRLRNIIIFTKKDELLYEIAKLKDELMEEIESEV